MSEERAVAYLRISDMDVDPNSQDRQADLEKKLWYQREWATTLAQSRNWKLVAVYEERHTGMQYHRPKLDELKGDLSELGAKYVLIFSDDRLARDDLVARQLLKDFEALGVVVILGNISLEGTDPVDRELFIAIKTAITKWERGKIVQRLNRGAKRARDEGTFFSERPNHFMQTDAGIIKPDADALDMLERRGRGESWDAIAAAYKTYKRDVQRTVGRVTKWKQRPDGVEWRRGRKVLRAIRENFSP